MPTHARAQRTRQKAVPHNPRWPPRTLSARLPRGCCRRNERPIITGHGRAAPLGGALAGSFVHHDLREIVRRPALLGAGYRRVRHNTVREGLPGPVSRVRYLQWRGLRLPPGTGRLHVDARYHARCTDPKGPVQRCPRPRRMLGLPGIPVQQQPVWAQA